MAGAHKVVMLGEIGVGKSSLTKRLAFQRFAADYKPTIGVEVTRVDFKARADLAATSLILWDTDGNFGDAIFRHVYIKQASAAVIVADLTRPDTIDAMVRLARGFADVLPGRVIHFVLNKSDLITPADDVVFTPPPALAHVNATRTSAATGDAVEAAFVAIAQEIARHGY